MRPVAPPARAAPAVVTAMTVAIPGFRCSVPASAPLAAPAATATAAAAGAGPNHLTGFQGMSVSPQGCDNDEGFVVYLLLDRILTGPKC